MKVGGWWWLILATVMVVHDNIIQYCRTVSILVSQQVVGQKSLVINSVMVRIYWLVLVNTD